MARLRIFTVHIKPSEDHPYESAQFVKEGFSWNAFFFTGIWALYHRLWWHALALFAYNFWVLAMFSSHMLSHLGLGLLDMGVHVWIGFEANEWLRSRLKNQGYLIADITTGDSELRAEQRFYDRYFSTRSSAA